MSEYSFHPVLERARLEDYLNLFRAAYGENDKLTLDYLRWLYADNPDGPAVGVDAYKGNELAAHYVTIPRSYRVGGQTRRLLLSVNTATHPGHQRKGLFKALAQATYERGAEQGFAAVIGVANAQSVHGFLRSLAFEHLGQVRLALWRKPRIFVSEDTALELTPTWLRWRLSNPSADYLRLGVDAEGFTLGARKGRVPFALGKIPATVAARLDAPLPRPSLPLMPFLTPVFHADDMRPLLPLRFQPSPWHVILRPLDRGCDMEALRRLRLDGLAMDTF